LSWTDDSSTATTFNNIARGGVVWIRRVTGSSVLRGNYRMAFDRINTS